MSERLQEKGMAGPKPVEFGPETPEEQIADWVESVRTRPEGSLLLAEMLQESLPFYYGRSSNQIVRLRGYILASFEATGLPADALPYALEELESGHQAYGVAAAAKALRGLRQTDPALVPFLLKAIENMRYGDDTVTFDCYRPSWPCTNGTTALAETLRTLAWMGCAASSALPALEGLLVSYNVVLSSPVRLQLETTVESIRDAGSQGQPDCCSLPFSTAGLSRILPGNKTDWKTVKNIELEDQSGRRLTFGEYFTGMPSVVVFFYTRCDNPQKCSLTVTRVAQMQRAMEARGLAAKLKLAAFTYDPGFDLPARLKLYGEERGVVFSENERFFRTVSDFKPIQDYFALGVNFVDTIVNRHRIELSILDNNGQVVHTVSHVQWNVDEVLDRAQELLNARPSAFRALGSTAGRTALSAISPVAIAFFPKCPMCWAAYMAAFGVGGLQRIPYSPWLLPVFVTFLLMQLAMVYRRSQHTRRWPAFGLALTGAATLFIGGLILHVTAASLTGVYLLIGGSVLNSLPARKRLNRKSDNFLHGVSQTQSVRFRNG